MKKFKYYDEIKRTNIYYIIIFPQKGSLLLKFKLQNNVVQKSENFELFYYYFFQFIRG